MPTALSAQVTGSRPLAVGMSYGPKVLRRRWNRRDAVVVTDSGAVLNLQVGKTGQRRLSIRAQCRLGFTDWGLRIGTGTDGIMGETERAVMLGNSVRAAQCCRCDLV